MNHEENGAYGTYGMYGKCEEIPIGPVFLGVPRRRPGMAG